MTLHHDEYDIFLGKIPSIAQAYETDEFRHHPCGKVLTNMLYSRCTSVVAQARLDDGIRLL